jgi:radical SAM protein with 4Fe4S-binding SPASM domain
MIDWMADARKIGAKAVIFSGGGEPLVNGATIRAILDAKYQGYDVGLITNGLALRPEFMVNLLHACTWIRISVDAGTAKLYEKTHGMDAQDFQQVLINIRTLVEQRKDTQESCDIGTAYLTGRIVPETLDPTEMREFVRISRSVGADYCQFRPFHDDLTDPTEIIEEIRKDDWGITIAPSEQKYRRMSDKVQRPYGKCYGVNFSTAIGADGYVYVCCHQTGKTKYRLGYLREERLSDIWSRRQEMFDTIDFKDCPPFCRCDEFNRVLWEIAKHKRHVNFL